MNLIENVDPFLVLLNASVPRIRVIVDGRVRCHFAQCAMLQPAKHIFCPFCVLCGKSLINVKKLNKIHFPN